ncbi:MAG: hypothetical protein GF368_05175 [Candidatus Aenigmarchaeota archaeon]|nr:hypothetical protein [Candidatus Aenigmarchaeota archaeon]
MKNEHKHMTGDPEIQCEVCDGEVKIVNSVNPRAYKCVCKKCNHEFSWVSPEERDLR